MKIAVNKKSKLKRPANATSSGGTFGRLHFFTFVLCFLFLLSLFFLYVQYRTQIVYRPGKKVKNIMSYFPGTGYKRIKTLDLKNTNDKHGDSLNETRLPVFELIIPEKSLKKLQEAIPDVVYEIKTKSLMENTSFYTGKSEFAWPFVSAKLKFQGKTYDVKIKYRGWNYDHYRLHKKSWRVRFKKNDLFFGLREINLINQRVNPVFSDILQNQLLREQGFLVPDQYLVHLRINGEYEGIQTFLEQPDEFFLTRHNRPVGDIYGEIAPFHSLETFTNFTNWQKYSSWHDDNDFESLNRLIEVLRNKGSADFKEQIQGILDVDQYLTYCADAAITAKVNPSSHNNRLYYDPVLGKFQIIPWYQMGYYYSKRFNLRKWRPVDLIMNDIMDGLFQVPEYHERFYQKLWQMINTAYHPSRLLQLVDEMDAQVKADVYADGHMHMGDLPKQYVTNDDYDKHTQDDIKSMIIAWDKYVRSHLRLCDLTGLLIIPASVEMEPDDLGLLRAGRISLYTSKMVSPFVEEITLAWKNMDSEIKRQDIMLRYSKSGNGKKDINGQLIQPIDINPVKGTITFQLNKIIRSQKFVVPYTGPAAGLFVSGFVKGAELKSAPTVINVDVLINPKQIGIAKTIQLHKIKAHNFITGDILDPEIVQSAPSIVQVENFNPQSNLRYFKPQGIRFGTGKDLRPLKKIRWGKMRRQINENVIIKKDEALIISAGAIIEIAAGKSIIIDGRIIAKGTKAQPIIFQSKSKNPWGVIAVNHSDLPRSLLRYCVFENGNVASINGREYTGAVTVTGAKALIENCTFKENVGDDALNCRYTDTEVFSCKFLNNKDAIDYDFCEGSISGSKFENNQDDAIDLSFSSTEIMNNRITDSGDKGISAGEKSIPFIHNNLIIGCDMGIAVKDLSDALIVNNTITKNRIGVALYEKKLTFGGSRARIFNSIIWGNTKDTETRDNSVIEAQYSNIGKYGRGKGNLDTDPLFVNSQTGDFRLEKKSPCLTRGNGSIILKNPNGSSLTSYHMGWMNIIEEQ